MSVTLTQILTPKPILFQHKSQVSAGLQPGKQSSTRHTPRFAGSQFTLRRVAAPLRPISARSPNPETVSHLFGVRRLAAAFTPKPTPSHKKSMPPQASKLLTTNYRLPTTNYRLPTTDYPPPHRQIANKKKTSPSLLDDKTPRRPLYSVASGVFQINLWGIPWRKRKL
jgi:hypothetical protein